MGPAMRRIGLLTLVAVLLTGAWPAAHAQTPGIRIAWDYRTLTQVEGGSAYARMIRLDDGDLLVGYEQNERIWVRRSSDGGRTWSGRILAAEDSRDGVIAANAELVQLASGDVLLSWNARAGGPHPDHRYALMVNVSTDGGRTWERRATVFEAGTTAARGVWEPMTIQLPSGELQLYAANEYPYATNNDQEITMWTSSDEGRTWSDGRTVSYRSGHRDGMPVAVVLNDGTGIAVSIEDPGWPGCRGFKPTIVWTPSVEEAWANAPIRGDSGQRWRAMDSAARVPCGVYAGAPYLAQFPQGETVISSRVRLDEDGSEREAETMLVAIGNKQAKTFRSRSWPFDVPEGATREWPSLLVKDSTTVTAIATGRALLTIDGHRIEEPRALRTDEVTVDGRLDEGSWRVAHSTFVGARSETNATFHPLWDDEHLYVACRVEDDDLWVDSEAAARDDDACVFDVYRIGFGSFRTIVNPDGRVFFQRRQGGEWSAWAPSGVTAAAVMQGEANDFDASDEGYTVEAALPWTEIGGRPSVGRGWGINYGLQEDRIPGKARDVLEYVAGNDPEDGSTWQRIELVDELALPTEATRRLGQTQLESAYPNPFGERVTISFELAEPGPATVAIYDVLGRRVETLATGRRPAGRHAVTWDGTDASGRPAGAGVYLCRLETSDAVDTIRVLYMR